MAQDHEKMKSKHIAEWLILPLVYGLFITVSSCSPKGRANSSTRQSNISVGGQRIISCEDLKGKELVLANQEVTISGYLVTHEEGPWLVSDPNRPLFNALTLKISDVSKIIAKDESRPRWWYESQDGYPVLISGVFRVGDYDESKMKPKMNHPYLEVSVAREVDTNNLEWAASQRK